MEKNGTGLFLIRMLKGEIKMEYKKYNYRICKFGHKFFFFHKFILIDDELWAIVETPGGKIKRLSTSGIEFCDDITSELLDINYDPKSFDIVMD